jgi:asparagine synthase (glutamine-hydrolysing)
MEGIGGIMNGIPCEETLAQITNAGLFVSPRVCLFGSPKPVLGTLAQRVYVLACDGELYNKDKLAKELRPLGFRIPDRSGAAVLLHSYMAWGLGCLDKLSGAFAFALWDGEQLLLARDQSGEKALYFGTDAGTLAIASSKEILSRLSAGNINEVKPGHYMVFR